MPAGDQQPYELLMDDQAWAREPIKVAHALGHQVYPDHGAQERYTCSLCRFAVIRVGCNIYGTAATLPCPGQTPDGASWVAQDISGRPAGHDWCTNCSNWIRMRADGTMRVHGTATSQRKQDRVRCAGSGRNDLTEYMVVTHPAPKEPATRMSVTGIVQADLVAGSWRARKLAVTVFKKVIWT